MYRTSVGECRRDGSELVAAEEDPFVGHRVGDYEVVELIGEGETGRVYLTKAEDGSENAMRCLFESATPTFEEVALVGAELTALRLLDHPTLVPIRDLLAPSPGLVCIVSPLMRGMLLSEALVANPNPVPPAPAVELATDIIDGLKHMHAMGLAHGRLSPQNVVLTVSPSGVVQPRILDIGVMMITQPATSHETGETATEDLLRFGAILHRMLAGVDGGAPGELWDLYGLGPLSARLCTPEGAAEYTPERVLEDLDTIRRTIEAEPEPEIETPIEPSAAKPIPEDSDHRTIAEFLDPEFRNQLTSYREMLRAAREQEARSSLIPEAPTPAPLEPESESESGDEDTSRSDSIDEFEDDALAVLAEARKMGLKRAIGRDEEDSSSENQES